MFMGDANFLQILGSIEIKCEALATVKSASLALGNDLCYLLLSLPQETPEISNNFSLVLIQWRILSLFIV